MDWAGLVRRPSTFQNEADEDDDDPGFFNLATFKLGNLPEPVPLRVVNQKGPLFEHCSCLDEDRFCLFSQDRPETFGSSNGLAKAKTCKQNPNPSPAKRSKLSLGRHLKIQKEKSLQRVFDEAGSNVMCKEPKERNRDDGVVDEEREVATNTCPEMGDVELLPRQQWVQEADSYFLFSQEKAEQRVEPFERQAEEREVTDTAIDGDLVAETQTLDVYEMHLECLATQAEFDQSRVQFAEKEKEWKSHNDVMKAQIRELIKCCTEKDGIIKGLEKELSQKKNSTAVNKQLFSSAVIIEYEKENSKLKKKLLKAKKEVISKLPRRR